LRFGPNILSTLFLFGLVFPSSPRYLNGSKLGRFFRGDVCGRDKFTKFEHRFQARLLTAATRQIENVLVMIPTFLGTVSNWVVWEVPEFGEFLLWFLECTGKIKWFLVLIKCIQLPYLVLKSDCHFHFSDQAINDWTQSELNLSPLSHCWNA
jgi:hypothetical protein